ncbi:MAG TPA: hypothetical protein VF003_00435 [Pseudonocardiaceae bacterium]
MVDSGAYPAEAAEHAVAAHLAGDPGAVASVARAGRAALRVGAVRAARQHLADGMRLAGEAAPVELLFALLLAAMAWIECLCRLGRLDEAMPAVERLIDLVELFP